MYGIPNLLSGVSVKSVTTGILGAAQGALWGLLAGDSGWHIYNAGTTTEAIALDSISEFNLRSETQLADYKIETGGFVTYDKVQKPNEIPLRLIKGGTAAERGNFLTWLEANRDETTLFDITTPETGYTNVTLVGYSMSRNSSSGATMIVADCLFQEVRLIPQTYVNSATGATTTTQTTTNASAPSAKPPSVLQRVAAQIPGGGTLLKIASKLGWQ